MTESTINYDIDFDIMNYYRSTDTATKILGSYLDRIKEHTGDSWDKIALDLSTTRKTINKIRKAEKPIRVTTYITILKRLMEPNYPRPEGFTFTKDAHLKNVCYKCHPDCPFVSLYPTYRTLKK